MNKGVIALLFFFFLLEGSVLQQLLPQAWGSHFVVVPLLVLSGIISISMHIRSSIALWIAFGFGLLYDVTYGPAIGIRTFSMVFIVLVIHWLSRTFSSESWMGPFLMGMMQLVYLLLIYGLYQLFDFTRVPLREALYYHIFPSIVFNVIVAYLIHQTIYKISVKPLRQKGPYFD